MRRTVTSPDELDETDRAHFDKCVAAFDARTTVRVGDYVRHTDGVMRQVAYLWGDQAQTCDGGSFSLLESGYLSMSGQLYHGVALDSLTPTGETRPTWVWFFHHDLPGRDRSVTVPLPVRVWESGEAAEND